MGSVFCAARNKRLTRSSRTKGLGEPGLLALAFRVHNNNKTPFGLARKGRLRFFILFFFSYTFLTFSRGSYGVVLLLDNPFLDLNPSLCYPVG